MPQTLAERRRWKVAALERPAQLGRRGEVDLLRVPGLRRHPRYMLCFAASSSTVAAAQRLEGGAQSGGGAHLVLVERVSGALVGAVRLADPHDARSVVEEAFGLDPEHRNPAAIRQLRQGVRAYVRLHGLSPRTQAE